MFPAVALAGGEGGYTTLTSGTSQAGTGYTWEGSTNTLTLSEYTGEGFVLPDVANITINVEELTTNTVPYFYFPQGIQLGSGCSSVTNFTFTGGGTLNLGSGFTLGATGSVLTIKGGTELIVTGELAIGEGAHGSLDLEDGTLSINPSGSNDAAIRVGQCNIEAGGTLNIAEGAKYGICICGKPPVNGQQTEASIKDLFSIADGGQIEVRGSDAAVYFEIVSFEGSGGSDVPTGDLPRLEDSFDIPNGYMGEEYGYSLFDWYEQNQILKGICAYITEKGQQGGSVAIANSDDALVEYDTPAKYVKLPVDGYVSGQTSGGSSRGPWYSVITEESKGGSVELTGSFVRIVSNAYARRGTELTLTPKPADGYMLKTLYINGEPVDSTPYVFNILEDVTVKAVFEKTQAQLVKEAGDYASSMKLIARSELVKRTNGKKAVKLYWYEKNGKKLSFDGYEIYRSVKKSSYGKKPIFTTKKTQYLNTAIKKGTRYYYKLRGYKQIGDIKLYSDWSTQAWRKVK